MEKIFCPKCGKENTSNSKFCTACGAELSATSTSETSNNSTSNNIDLSDIKKSKGVKKSITSNKAASFIIVLIIAAILGGIGWFSYNNHLNHLSEQAMANRAGDVMNNVFDNSDDMTIYYSKSANAYTVSLNKNSDYAESISDSVLMGSTNDATKDFIKDFKTLDSKLKSHVGSKHKNFTLELENPKDTDYVLLSMRNGKMSYNYFSE